MPKKQHDEESLSSFSFHVQQPGAGINGFLESAVDSCHKEAQKAQEENGTTARHKPERWPPG